MSIAQNIIQLRASLPKEVTLIAVSKFHPVEAIREAYEAGQRIFGESRAQELKVKQKELPSDIEWHFIGTLQRNKVKDIISYIHTIHSIDSLRLLEEVNKQAAKHNRIINVLLEVHIASEESKQGFSPYECRMFLETIERNAYPYIRITGLMGMATYTEDEEQVQNEFRKLHSLFMEVKEKWFDNVPYFKELSMGMSHDFPIAVEEGSTMIRVGTKIFGERVY